MLPHFLVIGAAKAGTTALFEYLQQHPGITVAARKEPQYWALGDMDLHFADPGDGRTIQRRAVLDRSAYEALFAHVPPGQVTGEASTSTLFYPRAASRIAAAIPDARLIVMLRQPADRAYSGYQFMRMRGFEQQSLADALAAEDERAAAGWHHMWLYTRMSRYADQLHPFVDLFPAAQLHPIVYDDFVRDPKGVLRDVFAFLGVDPAFEPPHEPRPHPSGEPRNRVAAQVLTRPNPIRSLARAVVPPRFRSRLRARLQRASVRPVPIDAAVRAELTEHFVDDIRRLERMIGRDLSAWLSLRRADPDRS